LNRALKGTDHAFSLEPAGMRKMVRDLRRLTLALGDGVKKAYASEAEPITKMGKSLVAASNLPVGHVLREADIAMKSPGGKLSPAEMDRLVGKRLLVALEPDQAFSLEQVE
jgi:sialic acid synthase